MRTYRGKTKDGKWVYGWYIEFGNVSYISQFEHRLVKLFFESFEEVIPETVGQSIPKKDVNNKTIYELDDVKVKYTDILGIEREAIGIVEIDDFTIMLDFPQYGVTVPMYEFFTDEPGDFEIVANEIDNPVYIQHPRKIRGER